MSGAAKRRAAADGAGVMVWVAESIDLPWCAPHAGARRKNPGSAAARQKATSASARCHAGFVVDIKGRRRTRSSPGNPGAAQPRPSVFGLRGRTGDGAGVLLQMPHAFLKRRPAGFPCRCPSQPPGCGLVFCPPTSAASSRRFGQIVQSEAADHRLAHGADEQRARRYGDGERAVHASVHRATRTRR